MVHLRLCLLTACLALAACSSEAPTTGPTTSSSAGGSAGATSSGTTGGAGGASTCTGAFIDVKDDGGDLEIDLHFTAYCGSLLGDVQLPGPVAIAPYGASTLVVDGCSEATAESAFFDLMFQIPTFPGADSAAGILYGDSMSTTWASSGPGSVTATVDVFEDVGGVVEGSYAGEVTAYGKKKQLSGTFRVCRVPGKP
jgi:hypothetical protein